MESEPDPPARIGSFALNSSSLLRVLPFSSAEENLEQSIPLITTLSGKETALEAQSIDVKNSMRDVPESSEGLGNLKRSMANLISNWNDPESSDLDESSEQLKPKRRQKGRRNCTLQVRHSMPVSSWVTGS